MSRDPETSRHLVCPPTQHSHNDQTNSKITFERLAQTCGHKIRSFREDAVPAAVRDQDPLPTSAPEGATSSSEGGIDSDPKATSSSEGGINSAPVIDPDQSVVQQDSSPNSKYWDEDLPAKRRRKPNTKYAHHLRTAKVKLGDLNQVVLMGLDWKTNSLHQLDTHYIKMMAQLATDPFTNEIDGDPHPCLLASKASQADNPTFEEAVDPTSVKSRTGFAICIANCVRGR
jgi:hypothetical protein